MDTELDFKKVNLYELFDVAQEASESEIRKSYRKKALAYHPDKNRDNPKANELFQKFSKALEVLIDPEARASYDKLLNAKREREAKFRQLDSKRRKLRDDLEAREREAAEEFDTNAEEDRLRREIDRIRKQGSSQLEEENRILVEELAREKQAEIDRKNRETLEENYNRIKVQPRSKDVEFTEDALFHLFKPFGVILNCLASQKSAVIEYKDARSVMIAADHCPPGYQVEILSIEKSMDQDDENVSIVSLEKLEDEIFGSLVMTQ